MRGMLWQRLLSLSTLMPTNLGEKFIAVIVVVQFTVMGLVTLVVEKRQRQMILHESQKRARALASNLAALSEGYLLSYNFIKLEQMAEKATEDEDVAYAIVHLHNGQVATYSGHPERQGKTLDDPVSQQALQAAESFIQDITTMEVGGRGYDVAIPVFVPGGTRKWGTVRLGFSLARAQREVQATTQDLFLLGLVALLLGTGGAILLARRLSKPIQQLVTGVTEVAKGNYYHPMAMTARGEIGFLAQRFEEMREALRLHVTRLDAEKQRLERTNALLKATQEQLIQHEKLAAVGKLAAKVAHEVNNPLAIVKTSFQILHEKIAWSDPTKEELVVIEEEIDRIARIIRHLLDFARPHSNPTALQVNEVIRNLIKFVDHDLLAHNIRAVLELAPELPVIQMSRDHLTQVLLNLVKNAQDAMPTGGTLRIKTAPWPGGVTISVLDEGVGIPETHLNLVFEPFFSTKQDGTGMGLGLAVSYNIIAGYGGSIEVESQPGQGTVFRLVLAADPTHIVREHWDAMGNLPEDTREQYTWRQEVS